MAQHQDSRHCARHAPRDVDKRASPTTCARRRRDGEARGLIAAQNAAWGGAFDRARAEFHELMQVI